MKKTNTKYDFEIIKLIHDSGGMVNRSVLTGFREIIFSSNKDLVKRLEKWRGGYIKADIGKELFRELKNNLLHTKEDTI